MVELGELDVALRLHADLERHAVGGNILGPDQRDDPLPADHQFRLVYNVFASPGAAGSTGFNIFLTPIPVPEPATAALLGLDLLGCIRKRRCVGL